MYYPPSIPIYAGVKDRRVMTPVGYHIRKLLVLTFGVEIVAPTMLYRLFLVHSF